MEHEPNVRFRGVDQQPLRGAPAALVLAGLLAPTCFTLFEGFLAWLSAALMCGGAVVFWSKILARRSGIEITDREYIMRYDSGEVARFDLGTLTDMRWEYVPQGGAIITLSNAEDSLRLPISRHRRSELAVLGTVISELHPTRMYRDVRAMKALGLPHLR